MSHALGLIAVIAAITLVYIDWVTWLQVNISIIYAIPLVLAGMGRNRRLLWALFVSLLCATFAVYGHQIGHGFSWNEQYFVNRLLASATMLLTAVLLDGWTRALDGLDERDRELRKSETQLRLAHRQKDEFLAMLAHELRNPLAPISHSTEVLLRIAPKDPGLQTALAVIRRQLTQLTRLLDDLLDVSRISEGRIQLRRQPIDADTIISQAIETVEPQLREKHQNLSVMTTRHGPLHVNGDLARLVQCVGNLLINAVKYTAPGGKISVRTDADAANLFIEVADSGSGIASEMLPHVFDLFVQSERTLDRAQGGLGVGLAVVKRLMEMHGGDVSARSDGVGCGSTFTLRLPRVAAPCEEARIEAVCKAQPQRLLIVDDNVDAATSLSMLLALQGHEIRAAYSAKEALAQVEAFRPDAALLDIGLPDMDGYELAKRLRALPTLSGLRLIALTGYGQPDDNQRALSAGFQCHIVKPADSSTLDRALSGATTGTPVAH